VETKQEWQRIKALFGAALERTPAERAGFLREACGEDESVREEVESLLRAHDSVGGMLEHSPNPPLPVAVKTRSIGPYRLLEKIGEGGMGQVWLAEQSAPLQRRVALKLIRWGIHENSLIRRFQAERQSLAVMDHPSIARVFEAGATPEGQPYFVMEYVPGVPITDYCDQNKLKVKERLELFIKVCEGVQHAHQKAIIHRDLKPANILVSDVDAKPVPRIIDFGLAKALDAEAGDQSLFTQTGGLVGTPGYMSPEQCDPAIQDVDTRTDVYSLGVILYLLLTGEQPFDTKELKKKPFHEMLRLLREEDPPRPSTKIGLATKTSTTASERGTEPKQLVNQLRGDLDWITLKAVEKDRARRYGTPSDLAADIRRHLENEPITARPASFSYRLQKYVRRHSYTVTGAAVLVALLIVFAVLQNIQLRKVRRERDREDRIAEFMISIFGVSNPENRVGSKVTAQELLNNAAKDIDTSLSKDPEFKSRMLSVMGRSYMNLGLYPEARSLFERGIKLSGSVLGQEDRATLHMMTDLGWTLFEEGRLSEAESLERKVLDTQRRVLGPEDQNTLGTMGNLAVTLCEEDRCSEAVKLGREHFETKRRLFGPEDFYTLVSMDNLAIMLSRSNQLVEAEKLEREALEIQIRVFGRENLGTLGTMTDLADIERDMGRNEEALKLYRETLDVEQRVLGPSQPETAVTRYSLACILAQSGQKDEALSNLRYAIDHGLQPRMDLEIEKDHLLSSLHGDPRFAQLVAHAKEAAQSRSTLPTQIEQHLHR
jgi:non-specific serine/threonine protein kinase/serine/threonine-protein kinase